MFCFLIAFRGSNPLAFPALNLESFLTDSFAEGERAATVWFKVGLTFFRRRTRIAFVR